MSIIESLRTYIVDYNSNLTTGAPVWVNYLGSVPIEYSIVPMPGDKIVETNILGISTREFPFAFQSAESTADNLGRLETIGFYEAFAAWLEQQTLDGVLPTLDDGKTAISLEANGWGFLYERGESDTAIYQILAKLVYEQVPGEVGN